MLRMAQLLRGSRGGEIDAEFVEHLHGRLFPQPVRVSRRTAFFGGAGALAAGLVAGLGLDRLFSRSSPERAALGQGWHGPELVGPGGHWAAVATVADVPHGAVRPFVAGSVQGFLINDHGNLRAISRICTHMGCALNFDRQAQALICPCHGAWFTLQGPQLQPTSDPYSLQLPALPPIKVRTHGDAIEVWTV
jgi:nitrite reductase/ring-hydroxylating ferredoxin subunit